jgi:hypothetical protein
MMNDRIEVSFPIGSPSTPKVTVWLHPSFAPTRVAPFS